MADPRKVKVLDSYQTLKAVRATAEEEHQPTTASRGPDLRQPATPARRTVVPSKHIIICHECGYSFQLHGRAKSVPCSKCRADLDLTDHAIAGNWTQPLKTAATIDIRPAGVVRDADLIGRQVLLHGRLVSGTVRCLEWLELGPQARFDEAALRSPDWRIAAGAKIRLQHALECRHLEISGTLRAKVRASGLVTIRSGGLLQGKLTAGHLQVETGGGLHADLEIINPALAAG